MAEVEIAPDFGAELKDGFKPVNAWVANGIAWLDDIQSFYRERSAIEKEYSQKLNALAKKYFEKKAKKSSTLSVGDTPTVTPGSLESASMTTWTVQLNTLESRAAEHDRLAGELITAVAEPLKNLETKYEDLRKRHAEYAAKLDKERDSCYADLKKTKSKYDSICEEVESRRKKADGDHGKQKAQTAFYQQQTDMRNTKNSYLIAINVTNKQKERHYNEYVPDLLNNLQALSESRISALNTLWTTASTIENQTMSRSSQLLDHQLAEIPRNNPVLDSMMFVRHNAGSWQEPRDFVFEPSPVWHDDDVMATDPASKTFLLNILTKSKSSLGELNRDCDAKRREVEATKRVRQLIKEGKDRRDEGEVVRALFHNQESLHESERKRITAEVEVSTITAAVGDLTIGARNHTFKTQTYKIPTNCDFCGDRLWGLTAKGMACEECGFTCHTKCELKVPADCPGELNKEQRKAIKAERQATAQMQAAAPPPSANGESNGRPSSLQRSNTVGSMNTLSSGYGMSAQRSISGVTVNSMEDSAPSVAKPTSTAPRPRIMAPPPAQYIKSNGEETQSGEQKGKMLYAYQTNGDGEITVSEGQEFTVVEPDDGSGWIKVHPSIFGSVAGLVPTSYTELLPPTVPSKSPIPAFNDRPVSVAASASGSSVAGSEDVAAGFKKKQGPAVAPRRGAKKIKHVEALYTYSAGGPGEVDMTEGERMVLVTPDQGDGWCEVQAAAGKGVVPSGWVKEV